MMAAAIVAASRLTGESSPLPARPPAITSVGSAGIGTPSCSRSTLAATKGSP